MIFVISAKSTTKHKVHKFRLSALVTADRHTVCCYTTDKLTENRATTQLILVMEQHFTQTNMICPNGIFLHLFISVPR